MRSPHSDRNDTVRAMTDMPLNMNMLNVNMLLCDAAQAVSGKLFILGGGLGVVGPKPQPMALALHIGVPWDQANVKHQWTIALHDEDGQPAMIGEKPLSISGNFEAGRPAGLRPGSPLGVALAINLPPFPLEAGRTWIFSLTIDGHAQSDWRVRFFKRTE